MKIFKDLPALVQALPDLAVSDWVDLPAVAAAQLNAPGLAHPAEVLAQPTLRFVLRTGGEAPRMGYTPWLPVAVLAQMSWPSPQDSVGWSEFQQAEFGRSQRFAKQQQVWADADVPEPFWPPASATEEQGLGYWYLGLQAHAWLDEETVQPTPFSPAELRLSAAAVTA